MAPHLLKYNVRHNVEPPTMSWWPSRDVQLEADKQKRSCIKDNHPGHINVDPQSFLRGPACGQIAWPQGLESVGDHGLSSTAHM